jgi:hypothetical protein
VPVAPLNDQVNSYVIGGTLLGAGRGERSVPLLPATYCGPRRCEAAGTDESQRGRVRYGASSAAKCDETQHGAASKAPPVEGGTDGSNPLSSSGESRANRRSLVTDFAARAAISAPRWHILVARSPRSSLLGGPDRICQHFINHSKRYVTLPVRWGT